jgi:hypothetical protein
MYFNLQIRKLLERETINGKKMTEKTYIILLMMMELIIFIVLLVQTNDFTPSSLCSSSRPIRLLQRLSGHADKSLHDCLTNRFER